MSKLSDRLAPIAHDRREELEARLLEEQQSARAAILASNPFKRARTLPLRVETNRRRRKAALAKFDANRKRPAEAADRNYLTEVLDARRTLAEPFEREEEAIVAEALKLRESLGFVAELSPRDIGTPTDQADTARISLALQTLPMLNKEQLREELIKHAAARDYSYLAAVVPVAKNLASRKPHLKTPTRAGDGYVDDINLLADLQLAENAGLSLERRKALIAEETAEQMQEALRSMVVIGETDPDPKIYAQLVGNALEAFDWGVTDFEAALKEVEG